MCQIVTHSLRIISENLKQFGVIQQIETAVSTHYAVINSKESCLSFISMHLVRSRQNKGNLPEILSDREIAAMNGRQPDVAFAKKAD